MFCNTHYSYECECPIPVAQVRQVPASVWVVVEIYSKSVQIGRGPATGTITGRAAIFAKPEVTQQVAARVYGVYATEEDARRDLHTQEGAEYLVERHEVWSHKGKVPVAPKVDPERHGICISCRRPAVSTFCDACQMERNRQMRERDGDIIADQQPVIKSDFAFRDPLPAHA